MPIPGFKPFILQLPTLKHATAPTLAIHNLNILVGVLVFRRYPLVLAARGNYPAGREPQV